MPNKVYRTSHSPPDPVARACDITRSLFNTARGSYDTDAEAVDAIARSSQLSPAAVRKFLQPSRHPKDVSLGVWGRLVAAYRRQLQQQLSALETEIARLEHLDPDDGTILDLLDRAKALVGKIEAAAGTLPPSRPD